MNNTIYVLNEQIPASERKRFVSCIFDFFFVFVTMFFSGLIVVLVGNIFNWDIFSIWKKIIIGYTYLAFFTFLLVNYFFFEWIFVRTMGKLMTGIVVVNRNGLKPNFFVLVIRTTCRLIPFDAFSFLGKSGRFWHDSFSNTYVVEKNALEKDMEFFYAINLIGVQEIEQ